MHRRTIGIIIAAVFLVSAWAGADTATWTHFGGTPAHTGRGVGPAPAIDTPRWIGGPGIVFEGPSSVAVALGRVYAYAKVIENNYMIASQIVCLSEITGEVLWRTEIEAGLFDSWASPTIDLPSKTVLIGSGYAVYCLDALTGEILWGRELDLPVVNASVTAGGRMAYVVGYTGFGAAGTLYALNLNPSDREYDPGEIVWTADLADTIGNTPAYYLDPCRVGHVVVADHGGYIRSFDALSGKVDWVYEVPGAGGDPEGGTFSGGVGVSGGYVYAATYAYYGGEDAAYIYKLDAASGSFVWRAHCERTASIPIVSDGVVYLAGGLVGFGSAPKLEAFDDAIGDKLWEFRLAGGWTHMPVIVDGIAYVGTIPREGLYFGPYTDLWALDLSLTPDDGQAFIVDHYEGAGSSPAYANANIYTIGRDGVYAFGPKPSLPPVADDTLDDKEDRESDADGRDPPSESKTR